MKAKLSRHSYATVTKLLALAIKSSHLARNVDPAYVRAVSDGYCNQQDEGFVDAAGVGHGFQPAELKFPILVLPLRARTATSVLEQKSADFHKELTPL